MSTSISYNKVAMKEHGICCYSVNDIIEWFLIISIAFISICIELFQSDLPLLQPKHPAYIPTNSTQYSYPYHTSVSTDYIRLLSLTLLPIYIYFIINIFILKITTYYQYQHEKALIRDIEIEKNRKNQPNKLRLIDGLYNNKFQKKPCYKQCIIFTKCVVFTVGITHLLSFIIRTYIAAPFPHYNTSSELGSFPSIFTADCTSVNCLLFIFMLSTFNHVQTIKSKTCNIPHRDHADTEESQSLFSLSSINYHTLNGYTYFGLAIFHFLHKQKISSFLLLLSPLYPPLHIAMKHIITFEAFPIDVISGFIVGVVISFISFNIFKHELLSISYIPSLWSAITTMEVPRVTSYSNHFGIGSGVKVSQDTFSPKTGHKRKPSRSITKSITRSLTGKRKNHSKFPKNPAGVIDDKERERARFPMTYGMKDSDFHLRELEEIALEIGADPRGHTPIVTDDDGIDLDDDEYRSDDNQNDIDVATMSNPFDQITVTNVASFDTNAACYKFNPGQSKSTGSPSFPATETGTLLTEVTSNTSITSRQRERAQCSGSKSSSSLSHAPTPNQMQLQHRRRSSSHSVNKRRSQLLSSHRKSIKLSLPNTRSSKSAGSGGKSLVTGTNTSKSKSMSPSLGERLELENIVSGHEHHEVTSITPSNDILANDTPISKLSVLESVLRRDVSDGKDMTLSPRSTLSAPRSTSSYHGYAE